MGRNVEVKLRLADREAAEARIRSAANAGPLELDQVDTFFRVSRGRLKLRRVDDGQAELIHYERADSRGPRESRYAIIQVACPAALELLLAAALGLRGRVWKRRTVYWVDETRVHLDRVRGLGDFLELEVVLRAEQPVAWGERRAEELLVALGLETETRLERAYLDLLC